MDVERGSRILIDGVDIANLSLLNLRSVISVIPQEALLFSGTIRSNIDPFGEHDDARLHHALRVSHLLDHDDSSEKPTAGRLDNFSLDAIVETQGTNLSAGQKSLVSLARAVVKDCPIIVMDEATASTDVETDQKIRNTIYGQDHPFDR